MSDPYSSSGTPMPDLSPVPQHSQDPTPEGATRETPALPAAYQMRTLQHLSRTLADEEARFRQSAAWLERLQTACRTVATEAMGLFALLEEERATAMRLAEEINRVSESTLASWPSADVEPQRAESIDDLPASNSSFFTHPDEQVTAASQKTEAFHEMWDASPTSVTPSRRASRRAARRNQEGVAR